MNLNLHGDWNELVRSMEQQMTLAPEGQCSIRVSVNEVVWDAFCYCFILDRGALHVKANRWYRTRDYKEWQRNASLVPDVRFIEKQLSTAEAAYFPEFFHQLETGNVHLMLEEEPGMVLDGAGYTVELFCGSELVRKFEWTSGRMRTRGAMKQLETLTGSSRNYFPNE